ncbi:MAG: hypothetical protein Q4P65_04370, partial [Eubacteriales bacterium]|nr:hypothetical protein [Eubacteriales bacterium]
MNENNNCISVNAELILTADSLSLYEYMRHQSLRKAIFLKRLFRREQQLQKKLDLKMTLKVTLKLT